MKNNSDIKTMLREAAVLFGITLIAGIILGFIYELTKEPIRIQQEKAIAEACKAVFADASDFKKLDYEVSGSLNLMLDETEWKLPKCMKQRISPENFWDM